MTKNKGKQITRHGKGRNEGVPRLDMTELASIRRLSSTPPISPASKAPQYDNDDLNRLEELIDGVLEKIKTLRLAGMINKDGADWMQHNLIRCLAIIEGMK